MIQLGEMLMILDLHRQGLSISAIARRTGRDPKTIRKYVARGLEPPVYGPRRVGRPGKLAPYLDYLRERITAFPDLSAVRLTREIRERGYEGAYTAVKRFLSRHPPGGSAQALRGPLRDACRPAGSGRLRPLRHHLHRRAGDHPHRLAVLPGARPLALHLRPLRPASGPADPAALSHAGLRGHWRRADRDPL